MNLHVSTYDWCPPTGHFVGQYMSHGKSGFIKLLSLFDVLPLPMPYGHDHSNVNKPQKVAKGPISSPDRNLILKHSIRAAKKGHLGSRDLQVFVVLCPVPFNVAFPEIIIRLCPPLYKTYCTPLAAKYR